MKATLSLIALLSVLVAGCATSHSRSKAWDYKVITYQQSDVEKIINQLSQDGWAVHSSSTVGGGPQPLEVTVILKRPRAAKE